MIIISFIVELMGATMLLLFAVRMVRTGIERAFGSSFRRVDPTHLKKRIIQLVVEDETVQLWGGEAVLCDGVEIGEVRSAGYGHTLGAAVALCEINAGEPVKADFIKSHSFEVDVAGTRCVAKAYLRTPYDPKSERVRADD